LRLELLAGQASDFVRPYPIYGFSFPNRQSKAERGGFQA